MGLGAMKKAAALSFGTVVLIVERGRNKALLGGEAVSSCVCHFVVHRGYHREGPRACQRNVSYSRLATIMDVISQDRRVTNPELG